MQQKLSRLSNKKSFSYHDKEPVVVVLKLGFQIVRHPPHFPDMVPSHYYPFPNKLNEKEILFKRESIFRNEYQFFENEPILIYGRNQYHTSLEDDPRKRWLISAITDENFERVHMIVDL